MRSGVKRKRQRRRSHPSDAFPLPAARHLDALLTVDDNLILAGDARRRRDGMLESARIASAPSRRVLPGGVTNS
jgi:hypothetical protein